MDDGLEKIHFYLDVLTKILKTSVEYMMFFVHEFAVLYRPTAQIDTKKCLCD